MKLLVAEDDPKLLKSLVHILESNRFSVDGVTNGEDALEHGQTGKYDGLILDIMMPGLDGLQVLQTLRRKGIKTPALFLTARTEVAQRERDWTPAPTTICPSPFPPPNFWPAFVPCFAGKTPICPTCSPQAPSPSTAPLIN